MKLKVLAGEYLWTKEGTHLVCEKGFAVVAKEDTEIEVDDDKHENASSIVKAERRSRGKHPDTGVDYQVPAQAASYEEKVEQEIEAELAQEEAEPKRSRRKKKAAEELPAEEAPEQALEETSAVEQPVEASEEQLLPKEEMN